eukprot:13861138-Alexandrium_andersonii.AAC.1
MTRSRTAGWLKPQEPPSGLRRMPNAPAGETPSLGLQAADAVARGGDNTSATAARTSPGVAPAAKTLVARSTASSGGAPVRTLGPRTPS